MALGLKDLHGNAQAEAGRALATVADLEAELERRRAEAEQAAREAAAAAKDAEKERARAEQTGRVELAELESRVAGALAQPPERPPVGLRSHAREWLYGTADEVLSVQRFQELVAADRAAAGLRALSLRAGRLLVFMAEEAGLDDDHPDYLRVDKLECACWSALMGRIHAIAGEG